MDSGAPLAYRVSEVLLFVGVALFAAISVGLIGIDLRLFAPAVFALYLWHCFWWALRRDSRAFASIAIPVMAAGFVAPLLPWSAGAGLLLGAALFMGLFQFGGRPVWRLWSHAVLRR